MNAREIDRAVTSGGLAVCVASLAAEPWIGPVAAMAGIFGAGLAMQAGHAIARAMRRHERQAAARGRGRRPSCSVCGAVVGEPCDGGLHG